MQVFVWGTGKIAEYIYRMFDVEKTFTILGFIDNAEHKWGKSFKEYPVYAPEILHKKEYDYILVLSMAQEDIACQMEEMGIPSSKIIKYSQLDLSGLTLRPITAAYLTGDYYAQVDECNRPDTISIVKYNEGECDRYIINDYREIQAECSRKYNLPIEQIDDIGIILKHQYFQLYCRDENKLGREEKECIRKIVLSMRNEVFFFDPMEKYEAMTVYFDAQKDLKYVDFFGKKLYLSRKMETFFDNKGIEKVSDLWYEQDEASPHRYFRNCDVHGIVVDCGACEGNFSLYNIEKIEKLFLIECDEDWVEALKATFEPYKEKVVICNKFLGGKSDDEHITLDELLAGVEPDYIKMDIEGDEVEVLHGAKMLLENNKKCKWNVCVYHKKNHASEIRELFRQYNIETEYSDGFINFIYDRDILNSFGLRKCLLCTK